MKYINAAEIMPKQLLKELQIYIDGSMLYVPKVSTKKEWGATSGTHTFYRERNREIQKQFHEGYSIDVLSKQYGLAYSTVKKNIWIILRRLHKWQVSFGSILIITVLASCMTAISLLQ